MRFGVNRAESESDEGHGSNPFEGFHKENPLSIAGRFHNDPSTRKEFVFLIEIIVAPRPEAFPRQSLAARSPDCDLDRSSVPYWLSRLSNKAHWDSSSTTPG